MLVESGLLVLQYSEYPSTVLVALLTLLWYGGYVNRRRVMSKFDGFDDYRSSRDFESGKGVTLDLGKGRSVTIHRAGGSNLKYIKAISRLARKYKTSMASMDVDLDNKLMAEVYAATIVVDWSGFTSGGEPIPCTVENVKEFLVEFPVVFDAIKDAAGNVSNFLVEQVQEDSENLGNL